MSLIPGFQKKISNDFSIHIAKTEEEIEEITNINVKVHGEDLEEPMKRLYTEHPFRNDILWIYINDNKSDKIVSTGVLLPEKCNLEGLKIPICEMGFVATTEEFRNLGLFQKINQIYEDAMKEYGYILSAIRGIPYYYRRFNYEFCIPFDQPFIISSEKVTDDPLEDIKIFKAEKENLKILESLYLEWAKDFVITLDFDKNAFSSKFINNYSTEFRFRSYIVEDNEKNIGFFSIGDFFGEKNVITFTANLTRLQMIKVLQFLKEEHQVSSKRKKPIDLTVLTPKNSDFGNILESLGGRSEPGWKWQILIPDTRSFLDTLKPLLEKRIQHSIFKNMTGEFYLSNYRETYGIIFEKGIIEKITYEKGYPEPGKCDLRVPNALLNKILLGDTSIDEMHEIIQDALYKPESLPLIEVLFPKKESYLLSYY